MTPSKPEYIETYLRPGVKFLIDVEDYLRVKQFPFYGHQAANGKWYVSAGIPVSGEDGYRHRRYRALARLLTGLEPGDPLVADHINGNPLDNRRINLRVCTQHENMLNRRTHKNNTSGFKGVSQVGPNRWAAYIAFDGKMYYLGVFDSPEKAHAAYCRAAAWLHGEFANFGEDRSGDFRLVPVLPSAAMPLEVAVAGNRQHQRSLASRTNFIIRPRENAHA